MIISHRHKFIFIKTKKTAGSSIEHYLYNYLGDTDILIGSELDDTPSINAVTKSRHKGWRWISQYYTSEWQNYFKFAVVRNPWDVLVSAFFYLQRWNRINNEITNFDQFIKLGNIATLNDWDNYSDNEGPVVDKILFYERLHEDLKTIPVPYNGEILTTFKKSDTRLNKNYREFYTAETKEKVYNIFRKTIDYFDYKF